MRLYLLSMASQLDLPLCQELRKIATPFVSYVEHLLRVSRTCLVRVDRNRYSVSAQWVGQIVSVRMSADTVTVVAENHVVAEHQRCFLRDQFICNPWHYLSVLEKKPGALRHGAPLKTGRYPKPLRKFVHNSIDKDRVTGTLWLFYCYLEKPG